MYCKKIIGAFEVWIRGLDFYFGVFDFIGFTCLRFCIRVLFGCILDFFEPLSGNVLVRVYVSFSLFLIDFCFCWKSSACLGDFEMKSQNSIGKRDFIDYMNRVDVWILRRHMSIIFVIWFASCIIYLPRTLEVASSIHVLLISLFSSILLFFFFFFDFLYYFLV